MLGGRYEIDDKGRRVPVDWTRSPGEPQPAPTPRPPAVPGARRRRQDPAPQEVKHGD